MGGAMDDTLGFWKQGRIMWGDFSVDYDCGFDE